MSLNVNLFYVYLEEIFQHKRASKIKINICVFLINRFNYITADTACGSRVLTSWMSSPSRNLTGFRARRWSMMKVLGSPRHVTMHLTSEDSKRRVRAGCVSRTQPQCDEQSLLSLLSLHAHKL